MRSTPFILFRRWISAAAAAGFIAALPARAVRASVGREGASFLLIPTGAGPAALGSAYSALADDAYAPVWNPAGLGFLAMPQAAAQHLSYIDSVHSEFLSLAYPLRRGDAAGLSAQYLGSGDIDSTLPGGVPNGTYSDHFAAYSLAYGHRLTDQLALGATTKWINAKIADVSANTWAADVGAMYRPTPKLSTAFVLTNAGRPLTFINNGDSLPLALHLGGAWQPGASWMGSVEAVYHRYGPVTFHVGSQYRPISWVSLRAGYETATLRELSPIAGLGLGAGFHVGGQELAYAWRPLDTLGDTHYFSFIARFGNEAEANRMRQVRRPPQEPNAEEDTLAPLLDSGSPGPAPDPSRQGGAP